MRRGAENTKTRVQVVTMLKWAVFPKPTEFRRRIVVSGGQAATHRDQMIRITKDEFKKSDSRIFNKMSCDTGFSEKFLVFS